MRRDHPFDRLRVASPCSADWNRMRGDDRRRFCDSCRKHVYDLSEMTRDEAVRLFDAHDGELCVRLRQRADGTVLYGDCPVGWRRVRTRLLRAAASFAALVAAALLGGCDRDRGASTAPAPASDPIAAPAGDPLPVVMGEAVAGPEESSECRDRIMGKVQAASDE